MLWIIRDALEMLQPRAEILRLRLVHCFVGEVFFQALKRLYHAKMTTNNFLEYITSSMFILDTCNKYLNYDISYLVIMKGFLQFLNSGIQLF